DSPSSGQALVCGPRMPISLAVDSKGNSQIYGVHNESGFHMPIDQTRGLIGIRLYAGSGSVVIGDLFVSYGRNAPPPSVVTSVFHSSGDKCNGGYFAKPFAVNIPIGDP